MLQPIPSTSLPVLCAVTLLIACGSEAQSGGNTGGESSSGSDTANGVAIGGAGTGLVAPTTTPFEACTGVAEEAENQFPPADIVFLIDNSPSMRDEIEWTRQNLNQFSKTIAARGLDPHIVVLSCLTDNCDQNQAYGICVDAPLGADGACTPGAVTDDTRLENYLHLNVRMPSNKLLARAISNYKTWAPMLRPGAETHFVAISDDNDEQSATAFRDALAQLSPPLTSFHFHGIYSSLSKETACALGTDNPCCQFAAPGGEGITYAALVAMTGGIGADLCAQDFAPVFVQFANAVIASSSLSCDWTIPPPPVGQSLDPNLINVSVADISGTQSSLGYVPSIDACGDSNNAWYYDDPANPQRVIACPETCKVLKTASGATLSIAFGCETQTVETLL